MLTLFRSLFFNAAFYILTPIYMLIFLPGTYVWGRKYTFWVFKTWAKGVVLFVRLICGLRHNVSGLDNLIYTLQQGPCIIACKHQSAWETIIFPLYVERFVIVLKDSLLSVPLFGNYLKKLGSIGLDRSQGIASIKKLMREGKKARDDNFSLLIYPEGTRSATGEVKDLNPGVAALYESLKVPLIPVYLNAGLFWPRKSFVKKPGIINIHFHEPIMPGLDRVEFLNMLKYMINKPS
jgi:1-acyl-sn-glycerol-3-phosphate acyltransferase